MGKLDISQELPPHARVVARGDVWMEGEALSQLARVASLPGCLCAVGMPDLHPGRGIPVGAAFAFAGLVYPSLIGGDAGCGARLVATTLGQAPLDALERRVDAAMEEDLFDGVDGERLFEAVWREGARGLASVEGFPAKLAALAAAEGDDGLPPSGDPEPFRGGFERALGTAGGGNHFVEISRVGELRDAARAEALGLAPGRLVVVAHSGSRGLGGALARRWGERPLSGEERERFLGELAGACRFARANRFLLAYRLLSALGAARPSKIAGGFDLIHNGVSLEPFGGAMAWVHRKGAAPARSSSPTLVLGSRGAPSWVMQGAGSEEALCSVAHGAGRRMGRSEAREKLKLRYRRSEVLRTRLGGRVLCEDPDLLFEEHPDAYKAIEPVIGSLVEAGLATPIAALLPVITVKR